MARIKTYGTKRTSVGYEHEFGVFNRSKLLAICVEVVILDQRPKEQWPRGVLLAVAEGRGYRSSVDSESEGGLRTEGECISCCYHHLSYIRYSPKDSQRSEVVTSAVDPIVSTTALGHEAQPHHR